MDEYRKEIILIVKSHSSRPQDVPFPTIRIDKEKLKVTDHFIYLGSTITSNLLLDAESDKRIVIAAAVITQLSKKVWTSKQLTLNTILKVCQACVLRSLLYGLHIRCLPRIPGIKWQYRVTNTLEKASEFPQHASHVLPAMIAMTRSRTRDGQRTHT